MLADNKSVINKKSKEGTLIAPYSGKTKMLLSYVDMLEKTDRFDSIIIHSKDFKKLKSDFESLFKVVKAAGGVVINEKKEILFIFRRGFWDLPKGKMDPGERKKETALREVQEETGVKNLVIGKRILTTRHVYKLNSGRRAIKKSYWYKMNAHSQKLVPEVKEDITEAHWINIEEVLNDKRPIFKNIINVLKKSNLLQTSK